MAKMPTLIYCAGGNRRYAEIAIEAGFRYGAQLPNTVYFPLWFADQNWRSPDRERYMAALAQYGPRMATVLDWEHEGQLPEVLDWAEEAAQFVERIVIVPKVIGGIIYLPRRVGDKSIVLGYSVPTKYAGTELPIWEFADWPVHLLGGSPHKQMELWRYFSNIAEVVSADGNMMSKMATQHCQLWVPGTAYGANNRWWPTLREAGIERQNDAPYEAFHHSCLNVVAAWKALASEAAGAPEEVEA